MSEAVDARGSARRLQVPSEPCAGAEPLYALSEGMNMGIWIGFKHVNYLIEHGIARYLRRHGVNVRGLFWGESVCMFFTRSELRYELALTHDEPVQVHVIPSAVDAGELRFDVALSSERFGKTARVARGIYVAAFRDRRGRMLAARPGIVDEFLRSASDA